MSRISRRLAGPASYATTLLLFGAMEVVSKPLMGSVDPLVLTFWRFVCGLLVLSAAMLLRGRRLRLGGRQLAMLATMGLLNTFASMSLLQLAVRHTNASRAATIFCSNPVLVVALAALLGWERWSIRKAVGLVLGVAGLVLVTGAHRLVVDSGSVYALLAAAAFACYMLVGRRASLSIDPITVNVVSFAFGLAALGGLLLLRGEPMGPGRLLARPWLFAFLGVGVSGLGYITFITAIRRMGAGRASTIFLLKPAVSVALAITLIGEEVSLHFLAGLLLAGGGSWLVARRGRRRPARQRL